MHHYTVFGGHLSSQLELSDLRPALRGRADWIFRVAPGPAPGIGAGCAETEGEGSSEYRLTRVGRALRLEYAKQYRFDLLNHGRRILWYPARGAEPENVRALLLGPLLSLALHLSGVLCLHGSAVSIGGRALVFLAPKHHGKSTLGLALTLAGGRWLSDDTVAVEPGSPMLVRPGVPSVRLWNDSVRALEIPAGGGTLIPGMKTTLTRMPAELVQTESVPLAAVYVLVPVHPVVGGVAATRVEFPKHLAAVHLASHTKLAAVLAGSAEAGAQFRSAAEIARSTPVYTLALTREFDRLGAATRQILGWHAEREPGVGRGSETAA